jgi:hypothetical protein
MTSSSSPSAYDTRALAERVKKIPLLSVPMTPDTIAGIPNGQKEFLSVMDYTHTDKSSLPADFNGMEVWSTLLTPTQDQADCGACWAFASSTCLADRFNVISRTQMMPAVSTNFSLLCSFNEGLLPEDVIKSNNYQSEQQLIQRLNELNSAQFQCGGNYLLTAWCNLYTGGTTVESCLPYKLVDPFKMQYELLDFGFNGRTAFLGTTSAEALQTNNFFFLLDKTNATWNCSNIVGNNKELCWDHTVINNQMLAIPLRHFFCGLVYKITDSKDLDAAIRYDIQRFGPVSTVMNLFDSFYNFDPAKDGVYAPTEDVSLSSGAHAVEIVGWGIWTDGMPFWWIRNSWSAEWGINNGCFRLQRGNKSCDVEANIITGIPYFFYTPDQYDRFLDAFAKNNPITLSNAYQNCLSNAWIKKYMTIYFRPIEIDLFKTQPEKRLTYFRILSQHPGQKAVLYPRYGITTKILASYPGVVTDPDPDPEVLLQWFQKQNSPPSSVTSPLPVPLALQWRRLFMNRYFYYSLMVLVWMILFIIVIVFIVVKK